MENEDIHRRAEERRRKVIANAEARLKRITDLAKLENEALCPGKTSADNEFIEFEVDAFVNEPSKPASSNGTPKFPVHSKHSDSVSQCSNSSSSTDGGTREVPNGYRLRNGSEFSQLDSDSSEEFARMFQRGTFGSNNFMFPAVRGSSMLPTGHTTDQQLPNGLNQMNLQDLNNSMNAMFSPQNSADLSNLLNALSGLASTAGPMPREQPAAASTTPQEETHPVLKPVLNIVIFLFLGVVTRIFFQFTSLKICDYRYHTALRCIDHANVFAPFMCLAIPLAIMSWGRKRTPMTGLLSAVMLFIHSPRTKSLILNWVRLTTLLRGLSRLFACYFFTFVVTHVVFELATIHSDISEHSSSAD